MSSPSPDQKKIICYRCRKPFSSTIELFSCDFCTLFWHLECLPSPIEDLPGAEWMCPQHPKPLETKKLKPNSKKLIRTKARVESIEEFEEADEIVKYGGVVHNITANTIEGEFLDYAERYREFNLAERKLKNDHKKIDKKNTLKATIEAEEWLDSLTSFQLHGTNHDGIQMLIDAANAYMDDSLSPERKGKDKVIDLDEKQYERFEAIQELVNLKGEDALLEMLSKN